jgi:hypothetical protein
MTVSTLHCCDRCAEEAIPERCPGCVLDGGGKPAPTDDTDLAPTRISLADALLALLGLLRAGR